MRRWLAAQWAKIKARWEAWRGDPSMYWKRDGSYIERDDK
jgi:hypothetical protein